VRKRNGRAGTATAFAVADSATFTVTRKSEVYTVHDAVWTAAGMEPFGGCLCIGCLEQRLGRKLKVPALHEPCA
jgi:hypothetical protein